jgi:hypothetical protein
VAHVAQVAEHVLGKDEVTRSIRVVGSTMRLVNRWLFEDGPVGGWHPSTDTVASLWSGSLGSTVVTPVIADCGG